MKVMILGLLIVLIISVFLKIANIIYNKCVEKKEREEKNIVVDLNLLTSKVSYEKFEKVSRESSVRNKPLRAKGDFMDFILESISFDDTGIENRILTLKCGEDYDR